MLLKFGGHRNIPVVSFGKFEKVYVEGEKYMNRSSRHPLTAMCATVLMIPGLLAAQDTTKPKKVLAPEQQEAQLKFKNYLAQRQALQKKALQALNAETLRGKIGDCKNPANTRAAEICLEKESETTKKNYSTFADAIRELLALRDPASVQPAASGPTGTPLSAEELTREFDNLQSAWQQYRTLGSGAAYDQYKGGTEAPVFSAEADQELLRAHMRELSVIYDGLLHQ
jgi:hypothetical protein